MERNMLFREVEDLGITIRPKVSVIGKNFNLDINQFNQNTEGVQYEVKKTTPKLFYQEALDELAKRKKDIKYDTLGDIPPVEAFVAFSKAIEREEKSAIKTELKTLIGFTVNNRLKTFPSVALIFEINHRMLLLGLGEESEVFRTWCVNLDYVRWGTVATWTEEMFFDNDIAKFDALPMSLDINISKKNITSELILLKQLCEKIIKIDIRKVIREPRYAGWGNTSGGDKTLRGHHNRLILLFTRVFSRIQIDYQGILNIVLEDLRIKQSCPDLVYLLETLKKIDSLLSPIESHFIYQNDPFYASHLLTVSKSSALKDRKTKKYGYWHNDIFLSQVGKGASVKITLYDSTENLSELEEMTRNLFPILKTREKQIAIIERIYGLQKDKNGNKTIEAEINAQAIKSLGKNGFNIHSNNDWRKFALKKFEIGLQKFNDKTLALYGVINTLEAYLLAFTVHTPYNIDDFGNNFLKVIFPRILTGQYIHDCAVYALRIASMLSLVREHPSLKLKFRFVQLPVHIGLVITGDMLPISIIHNDSFYRIDDMNDLKLKWSKVDNYGNTLTKPVKIDENLVLGELAATYFIQRTDMPFYISDVPNLNSNDMTSSNKLWETYKKIRTIKLFGDITGKKESPFYQYHLQYLKIMALHKKHYNEFVVEFWINKAVNIYKLYKDVMNKHFNDFINSIGSKKDLAKKNYLQVIGNYEKALSVEFDKVLTAPDTLIISNEESKTIRDIDNNPNIIGKRINRAYSERMDTVEGSKPFWQNQYEDHVQSFKDIVLTNPPTTTPNEIFENSLSFNIEPKQ